MSTQKLNVLIVEDDLLLGIETESKLKKMGYNVIGIADNSGTAFEMIYADSPDVILMDIDIKGKMTGTQIGEKIKHLDIPVLYLTSFDDDKHFEEAQKSNIIGYLIKPVQSFTLKTSLALAVKNTLNKTEVEEKKEDDFVAKDSFFFKKNDIYQKVPVASIAYIQADGNYSEIFLKTGEKFIARITLNKLEEALPGDDFMRIHRKYIARLDLVKSIDMTTFKLHFALEGSRQVEKIPFSRSKREELEQKMRFFT